MADDVEKRVVQMEFDNSKFDKNVKKSSSTLDEFKEKLQMKDVSKSIDAVARKFSIFDAITFTVINNITNRIVNLGIQMVKSLSVDNISAGWDKFGQKTTSVATIAAQNIKIAGRELSNYEEKMEAVNEQLEKLNWYTDETSYNFTDMVDNIGKFTAAGVDLDKAVKAMMGIANWAALSGQNATTASRAMYQLAQALGKGSVTLQDWRSVENANMGTIEFKQTVLETAAAMGELTKQGDTFVSKTGKKITALNFADTLADKWFTSDILVNSLEKYSAAVERVYELSKETGLTASEVMARYSSELDKFGLKAFKAAQEARTFADSLNSVKDAVSTGWMNTAEKIFGGYDESKELWTDLANELYDVFAEGGNFRNQILGIWRDLGGRENLFDHGDEHQGAFWNIYDSVIAVVNKVKQVKDEIFPTSVFENADDKAKSLAYHLKDITDRIDKFTARIKKAVTEDEKFTGILRGIAVIFKLIGQVISGIRYAVDPIITLFKDLFSEITTRMSLFGNNLTKIQNVSEGIERVARKINNVLASIIEFINPSGILNYVFNLLSKIKNVLVSIFNAKGSNSIADFFKTLGEGISKLKASVSADKMNDIVGILANTFTSLVSFAKGLIVMLKPLLYILQVVIDLLGKAMEKLGNAINSFITKNESGLSGIMKLAAILIPLSIIGIIIYNLYYSIKSWIAPLKYIAEGIADTFDALQSSIRIKGIAKLISSITLGLLEVAIAISILSSIDENSLYKATAAMIIIGASLFGIVILMNKIAGETQSLTDILKKNKNINALNKLMLIFSVSMLAIATAFKTVAQISWDGILKGLAVMGAALFGMFGLFLALNKFKINTAKIGGFFVAIALAIPSILAFAAALNLLAKVNIVDIGKGLLVLAGTLVAFAALALILSKAIMPMLKLSLIMVTIGAAFVVFSLGLLSLAGVIGAFAAALGLLQKINWSTIAKGAAVLGGSLLLLLGLAALFKNYILDAVGLAAALILLATAFNVLVLAFVPLQLISWESLGKGALLLAGSLLILGVAAFVLKPVIGVVVAFAASLFLIGSALFIAAVGLTMLNSSLALFTAAAGTMGAAVGEFLASLGPKLVDAVTESLKNILAAVIEMVPMIGDLVLALVDTLLDILYETGPKLVHTVNEIIILLLKELTNSITEISKLLLDIILKILDVIADNMVSIVRVLVKMIVELTKALATELGPKLKEIVGYLLDFLLDLAEALILGLLEKLPTFIGKIVNGLFTFVVDIIRMLGVTIKNRTPELIGVFMELGQNIMIGLWNGIVEAAAVLFKGIPFIGGEIAKWFRSTLQIHSPSRLTAGMGHYLMEGFAVGMNESLPETKKDMVKTLKDCVDTAINKAEDIIDDGVDDALVISPVMDLSNVTAGAHSISSMMSSISGKSISVSGDLANRASSEISRSRGAALANQNAGNVVNNAGDTYHSTFNITSDDPEEVAREVDIRMQQMRVRNKLAKGGA